MTHPDGFSDEDLAIVKESAIMAVDHPILALLHRLECAEKAAKDCGSPDLYNAWLASKGSK